VKDFIAFAISTGQEPAEQLSYAKLPDSLQKQGQEMLSQLTANGQLTEIKQEARKPYTGVRARCYLF
jgi:hypothetical protein